MGFWSSTGTDKPNGGKWGTENFIGDNGKNAASIINGKLYVYDPSQFDMSSVAGIPDLQVASQQDIANVSDPHGPGNGEGGSDWANILKGVAFVGGGAALTGALGGAAAGGGLTSGAGTGLEAAEAGGAAGGSGTYGAITGASEAPWGVNQATGTGAFDTGASEGVFSGTGQPLYNPSAGSGLYQTITSLGVPPGAASSVVQALSGGVDLKTALQVAGIGSTLASAVLGSSAAKQASQVQAQSADAGIAEQRRQFDLNRSDNAPFLTTGTNANARLGQLLGTNPADGSVPADASAAGGYGSLLRRFGVQDLNTDPVYQSGLQFGMNQGRDAINARATQAGNYDSGATLKALTRFGNDYGSTKANDSYNRYTTDQSNIYSRLTGQSGSGQTAVGQNVSAGNNATNAITDLTTGAGNARAAGIVGGANAWGTAASGLSGMANNYANSQILERLLSQRGGNYGSVYGN